MSIQAIITQKISSATSRQNLDSDERHPHLSIQANTAQSGSPKMLKDYAKKKRGLAYSMHRESLGEKRVNSSKSNAGSIKDSLSLNSQAISLQ